MANFIMEHLVCKNGDRRTARKQASAAPTVGMYSMQLGPTIVARKELDIRSANALFQTILQKRGVIV